MRIVRDAGRPARRGRAGRRRGGVGLRRRHGLRRAVRRARPPRRGAGRRRPPRRARARRARLLDPAPAPEGRRGGARARPRRRDPRARCTRRRAQPPRRSATSAPARSSSSYDAATEPVLLPRDEHPAPGRAPGHRAASRRRPRRAADRGRRGAAAADATRVGASRTATRSRCGCTPRTRPPTGSRRAGMLDRVRGPRRRRGVRPAEPSGHPARLRLRGRQRGRRRTTTRCSPR